ncbi:hypothetical protein HU200_059379 [Digitaria exilis]|uniref:DUF4220 domain-containing protein n=1 Tax=Digitaria exilis TaxID=1010633 RepID=A0A835ACT2_9POAL|nr:hypothetical protein HU200_059379 [Digitaria exilis]
MAMAPAPSPGSPSFNLFGDLMEAPPILELMRVVGPWGIWSVLRLLDWILGPKRRSSGHWFVQYGALAAYYLPTPLLFYAANAVSSLPSLMQRFFCGLINLLLLSFSSSPLLQGVMTAYTLRDAPLQRWRILPWLPYILWLQVDSIMRLHWDYLRVGGMSASEILWAKIFLVFYNILAGCLLLFGKGRLCAAAPLDYETMAFADYMTLESRRPPAPFFDGEASNLDISNCKYPIMQKDGHWVSIKDLLQCDREPIRNCAAEARDIFLSYSLCRLLARRYYGFRCAEEGNAEVRQLTVTQLLHDHKRAFTIVDVQLAFLHDHFFTSYNTNTNFFATSGKQAIIVTVLSFLWILVPVDVQPIFIQYFRFKPILISQGEAYYLVSGAVLAVSCGTLLLRPVVPKYWLPIQFAFRHYYGRATRSVLCPPFIWRHIQHLHNHSWRWTLQLYWRNKIGQYSLIKDYDRRSTKRLFVACLKNFLLSQVSYGFIKHHPVSEEDIRVPDSVRESVARALQGIDGPPTNGSWCLQRNRDIDFDDLAWTLRQETHTHTILIWHIATSYCDMLPLAEASTRDDDDLLQKNHGVATALSRYCAYLVAFHPELLPEQTLSTKALLQQVLKEAKNLLGRTRVSMEEKHAMIRDLQLPEDDSSLNTFQKGVKLGCRLADMLTSVRWKVMAEFWAETVLYVAPSDDVATAAAHIECLANGGEFVTHLWAMLSNAGILKRATEEWSPRQSEPESDISIQEQDRLVEPVAPVSSTAGAKVAPQQQPSNILSKQQDPAHLLVSI